MPSKELQTRLLSSLAKVFPTRIVGNASKCGRTLQGQEISFQLAYRLNSARFNCLMCDIEIHSPLGDALQVYQVGNVPSMLAIFPNHTQDEHYITKEPGLFPDPLFPFEETSVKVLGRTWKSFWFSVKIASDCPAGIYPVEIIIRNQKYELLSKSTYRITVEPYALPKQKLLFTQWFHCDCIADVHHVPVFSEAHWNLIEKYMRLAADHGQNVILTPVVTPPLDTAVGAERPTVQLVEIEKDGDTYHFDCTRLRRYIDMALRVGMTDFEISHFFTQWGAEHAPKVVARENGRTKKIFGWKTDATSQAYVSFLTQLIPAVIDCFTEAGVARDRLWFHASDEPNLKHLEQYRKVSAILNPLIEGCHHMDALSNYEFYTEGLIERPVVTTDHIQPYLDAKVDPLWCYYCCAEGYRVSNRFFAMPSSRTRIIGVQMYKYRMQGFLQWGYNFYYTQLSQRMVNPFAETDADCSFPSGDAFSVYPYKDGAIPSLRQKVFGNALEDMRLLSLLEEKIGYDRVVELIERVAGMTVTFDEYPHDEQFFDKLYDAVFEALQ